MLGGMSFGKFILYIVVMIGYYIVAAMVFNMIVYGVAGVEPSSYIGWVRLLALIASGLFWVGPWVLSWNFFKVDSE